MADITSRYDGNVEDSGLVNWRGDQTVVPSGQSVFSSSSVKLAPLGARKVVGDRVFRYALAGGAVGAGDIAQAGAEIQIDVTAGSAVSSGAKVFTWYAATAIVADRFADGMLYAQSGTAANLGYAYRVKSHAAIAKTTTGTLFLYDSLKLTVNVADKWSLAQNPYSGLTECTAGTAPALGVAPIAVTSGDYFWLQTYGPCCIKSSAVAAAGQALAPGATGQAQTYVVATTASQAQMIGISMQICTASEYGLAFLTIAP